MKNKHIKLAELLDESLTSAYEQKEESPEQDKDVAADEEADDQQDSQGRLLAIKKITKAYTKMLRSNLESVSTEELAEIFIEITDSFGLSKGNKVQVLRTIKNQLQA